MQVDLLTIGLTAAFHLLLLSAGGRALQDMPPPHLAANLMPLPLLLLLIAAPAA